MEGTTYDSEKFTAAHGRFVTDPASLSDEDLAQFDLVDKAFAERARAARAGYVERETPTDRAPLSVGRFRKFYDNVLSPSFGTYKHKVKLLEQRIEALEARPVSVGGIEYAGTYNEERHYTAGQLTTKGGGLWLCVKDSQGARPGADSSWKLIVKSGAA